MRWFLLVCGCAVVTRPLDVDLAHELVSEDLASTQSDEDLAREPDLSSSRDLRPTGDLGSLPRSWGSPSTAPTDATLGWNGNYATSYTVTLAADDPAALIYYTTDGSAPTLASLHMLQPALPIAATTRLRWFALNAAGSEAPHDDSYGIDAANQTKAGFVIYDVSLDGQGPVATVNGAASITAQASFRFWYQSTGCSGFPCAAQLVYGVDKLDQGCLFDGGAYGFAGSSLQTKSLTLTVPTTPGVHEVQVAQIEDLSCTMAMGDMALKNRPNLVRVGILIVP